LITGNPANAVYGLGVQRIYKRLDIDAVECVAWVSPAMLLLAAIGLRQQTSRGQLVLPLVLFLLWSLGPSLLVAGRRTPLLLPGVLLRWLPVVSQPRIPSRAIVVVYMLLSVSAD
jgi:hypothetical protein